MSAPLKISKKLWAVQDLPRLNWTSCGFYLAESPTFCELCGQRILKVHKLTHAEFPLLHTGGTCAEKLCETYIARDVERAWKKQNYEQFRHSIVSRFNQLQWRTSKFGNKYKLFGPFVVSLQENSSGCVVNDEGKFVSKNTYSFSIKNRWEHSSIDDVTEMLIDMLTAIDEFNQSEE